MRSPAPIPTGSHPVGPLALAAVRSHSHHRTNGRSDQRTDRTPHPRKPVAFPHLPYSPHSPSAGSRVSASRPRIGVRGRRPGRSLRSRLRTPLPNASILALVLILVLGIPALAQQSRPIPYPVFPTQQFERAIANGTRTTTGEPGPNHWTNTTRYRMDVRVDTTDHIVEGNASITYTNHSPETLTQLHLHLRQNIYRPGAIRNRFADLTGGMRLSGLTLNGLDLAERQDQEDTPQPSLLGTLLTLPLDTPLAPGDSATITTSWFYLLPQESFRNGHDTEVYLIAYWYPQMAVYDDVHGWDTDQYMGSGEFYMGFADYDVRITVPENVLVASTGTLQNPEDVLSETTLQRLARASAGEDIVSIVGESERIAGSSTRKGADGTLTWHFTADSVRDFVFGFSRHYVWDATPANTGETHADGSPKRTLIHALYRPDRTYWKRTAEYAQFSIEDLSTRLLPYPWPHMTVCEGIIGGGMEYPMLTFIGSGRSERGLFGTTYHEISHMWLPMLVAQDEKAHAWMDEGLTSFNTSEATAIFWNDNDVWRADKQSYYGIARSGNEVEIMRHSDLYPPFTSARTIAAYNKPAVAFHALRGLVGNERFYEAYRTYVRRWTYKHPTPFDLFNSFEDVLGEDLGWFWTSLFYQTWTMDHRIVSVSSGVSGWTVAIEDLGLTPMPAPVTARYADGRTLTQTVPVSHWLAGHRTAEMVFEEGPLVSVAIDPQENLPDVDRSNNIWTNPAVDPPVGAGSD